MHGCEHGRRCYYGNQDCGRNHNRGQGRNNMVHRVLEIMFEFEMNPRIRIKILRIRIMNLNVFIIYVGL